jgi:DNA-binding CsgD family transcriptional regulator
MDSQSTPKIGEFADANQHWDLERLYIDFAIAKKTIAPHKKKGLTHTEKERLRGLLCGYSPAEIAQKLHLSPGGLQVAITDLYRYTEALTQRPAHTLRNWRDVVEWLEAAGYKKLQNQPLPSPLPPGKQDWESAPDISSFYDRTKELSTLKQWIVQERCQLVAILGMGGIGKTALSVKLAKELTQDFDYVIWQSLRYSPPLSNVLARLLSVLGQDNREWGNQVNFSHSPHPPSSPLSSQFPISSICEGISQLIACLKRYRCLLVLDELEALLQPEELAGRYSPEHQAYQQFIKRVGEEHHNSCLCITSQEKTPEVAALTGPSLPVRCFYLAGLEKTAAQSILFDKGLTEQNSTQQLIDLYRGNPLALKIVAATIQDVFGGSVDEFLRGSSLFVGDFGEILSQQFQRLSPIEKQILYALALERYPVTFFQLRDLLRDWAFLEKTAKGYTLQPMVMKYVTEELIKQICNEALVVSRTRKLDNTSLLHHRLLLQFQSSGCNEDKVLNYRKILLKVENELRSFVQDTQTENLEEQLSQLLSVIPKRQFESEV